MSPETLLAALFIALNLLCWRGGPIVSAADGGSHFIPIALASAAIASSAALFLLTPNVARGFNIGTLLAALPAMLGVWSLLEIFTRNRSGKSSRHQISLRSVFILILCFSIGIGAMSLFQRAADRAAHDQVVRQLVSSAKTILSTSTICVDDGQGGMDLIATDPQDAIDLCTQAIELSPKNASAYQTRALAYESLGMTQCAKADRAQAERFD